jgi:hypothetical protein
MQTTYSLGIKSLSILKRHLMSCCTVMKCFADFAGLLSTATCSTELALKQLLKLLGDPHDLDTDVHRQIHIPSILVDAIRQKRFRLLSLDVNAHACMVKYKLPYRILI